MKKTPGLGSGRILKVWYWKISEMAELEKRKETIRMCGSL